MSVIQGAENTSGVTLPFMSRATRNVAMRSRFSCRGWTTVARTHDGHRFRVQFESLLELLTIHMAATRPNFADLIEQPFEVSFIDASGKKGHHHIDLLVVLTDGRRLAVAVKPAAKVTNELREELGAIKRHLPRELADDLILVTDQNFTRAQALNALRYFEFSKHADPVADQALTAALEKRKGIVSMGDLATLAGLAGRGYRAAFRAAFQGKIQVLSEGLIGEHSLVKARAA
ncbi:hypothetical protein SAMN04488527_11674 [Aliiroseovarius crassostreae]|uniref:TnsA endonuclease N-terminal domain-containing protein n=1 Tax=Aliiroseovarius crassostreae TaxID=154981 RepID=A0A0P7IYA6_9RHOB|nr:hypothetical protein [Aliiroseovarius crassostreae]KPN64760.1 hypothetical protein AKJ29_05845 [Aliiroseovarius crassostreae]SFU78615.1 hypothetical protein SAMN04488527_11674 [Aliiroseovarius crassostreae]